ncbi:low-density lipoprotein receptor-related protein 11 isoform X4 [Hippopotamus amphibius kiboko]|uniref:low-density lipoprotein receptor-related protein 11 isoform X4 n=1 Tax=Hippopotamus amphibius kiboko TaxID=575201 RepID=UPI002598C4CE|nr:low-density lipoprotein receptor-related protein 11 isoform X4 [Hippopotamus amphibius kiboko]
MASAAPESAGSGRRRPPRLPALRGLRLLLLLLLLSLWLPGGRAAGPPSAPLSELHAQLSGVEQLLEEFRRQLQQERPREELELELRAGGGPQEGCPGPGGGGYRAMPDAIIRTKDSIAAGASILSAPAAVRDGRQCLEACCLEPRCSVAVVELPRRPAPRAAALGCYLFNCTARGQSVCKFALHRGYSSYSLSRAPEGEQEGLEAGARASPRPEKDEPPFSKAGQDVVLHLPTDGVILDGRESTDDHAIIQYEWTLLQGDPSVDMKVPQSGTLKLSHLQEGTYTFQLTVMDTAGQRSSDNVSVTVLPVAFSTGVSFESKMVTHTATAQPRPTGPSKDAGSGSLLEKSQKATTQKQPPASSATEKRNQATVLGPESRLDPGMPESGSSGKDRKEENYIFESKSNRGGGEHPAPEAGAVLPLALGLAITALLLLMVVCRLRLVKQKLKKARPITSEEADYLINGMYL